jgi:adenylate cyclase
MEAPPLERKLVTILAADIQGYSRLMGIDEENTLATLSAHRALTDAIIAQHGGRICGTAGDSVLAEFASVFAAVQCAVEIQRDLAQANLALGEERRMWFRIGINIGDVMVKDGDIFGDGVNIAARIEGLAEPAASASRAASTTMSGARSPTASRISASRASRTSRSRSASSV